MKIVNIFDAIKVGNYEEFIKFYDGDIGQINIYSKLNMLQMAMIDSSNPQGRINIIKFLILNGIEINYVDTIYHRNALHILYISNTNTSSYYLYEVSKFLIDNGIDINATDKYGAISLSYLISVCKANTQELKELIYYLLKNGADYDKKDNYGKSCIDYAREFPWRNEFIDMVSEVKNDK